MKKVILNFFIIILFFFISCNQKSQRYEENEYIKRSDLKILPYWGYNHKMANLACNRGEISYEVLNRVEEDWNNYYTQLIIGANLGKYNIYEWSLSDHPKEQILRKIFKEYSTELEAEFFIAERDERMHFALAKVQNKIGLLITIIPKRGEDGLSTKPGETYKIIFIEGLYEESVPNLYKNLDSK